MNRKDCSYAATNSRKIDATAIPNSGVGEAVDDGDTKPSEVEGGLGAGVVAFGAVGGGTAV
jgi:hypothetical protein